MGLNRETKRAIQRDLEENPELYAALADTEEDELADTDEDETPDEEAE